MDLKVKMRSNDKTDIKYEFLDPKNPRKHMSISSVGQTVENEFSRWLTAAVLDLKVKTR